MNSPSGDTSGAPALCQGCNDLIVWSAPSPSVTHANADGLLPLSTRQSTAFPSGDHDEGISVVPDSALDTTRGVEFRSVPITRSDCRPLWSTQLYATCRPSFASAAGG